DGGVGQYRDWNARGIWHQPSSPDVSPGLGGSVRRVGRRLDGFEIWLGKVVGCRRKKFASDLFAPSDCLPSLRQNSCPCRAKCLGSVDAASYRMSHDGASRRFGIHIIYLDFQLAAVVYLVNS